MNKAFEKIKVASAEIVVHGTSEKPYYEIRYYDISDGKYHIGYSSYDLSIVFGWLKECFEIVQEVAEEYKGGWIPCSERLPEDDSICIVTVEYPNNETVVDYGWFDRKSVCWFVGMQEFRTSNILAWQPLPEPFKERD